MIRPIALALALAAWPAAAQNSGPTVYVRAFYSKWMPGQAQEGRKFLTEVANKVVAARNREGGNHIGQVRLYRVFPSAHETGHDILRLAFYSSPPDLGSSSVLADRLAGTGMTPAEYGRKLESINETVKEEIWTDVFRQGSMAAGDYVRVTSWDPPDERTSEFAQFHREYTSAMAANHVKLGHIQGWDMWRLALTPNSASHNYVSLTVYKDSASAIKGLPSQTEAFYGSFPKGDYNQYHAKYSQLGRQVKTTVYRVESAIWK